MPWTNKIRAILTLSDMDLGRGKFTRPLAGGYQSDMFKPVADVNGYLTSTMVETTGDTSIELDHPIEVTLTFTSGNFTLEKEQECDLKMGYRRIGWFKVLEILEVT